MDVPAESLARYRSPPSCSIGAACLDANGLAGCTSWRRFERGLLCGDDASVKAVALLDRGKKKQARGLDHLFCLDRSMSATARVRSWLNFGADVASRRLNAWVKAQDHRLPKRRYRQSPLGIEDRSIPPNGDPRAAETPALFAVHSSQIRSFRRLLGVGADGLPWTSSLFPD